MLIINNCHNNTVYGEMNERDSCRELHCNCHSNSVTFPATDDIVRSLQQTPFTLIVKLLKSDARMGTLVQGFMESCR
jgi:hypothetical protein